MLRWGLWMAPVINSFLRQSPDPSWYNQDGAIRTVRRHGGQPVPAGRQLPAIWSLAVFTGLLAYDWLRVLIWFDHMGLRVATLVNLTFIGGDRADEAAARFAGHAGRTRVIPEGIRRFATWAPLLIPFYIPHGPDWDRPGRAPRRSGKTQPPVADAGLDHRGGLRRWPLFCAGLVVAVAIAPGLERRARLRRAGRAPARRARVLGRPEAFGLANGFMTTEIWRRRPRPYGGRPARCGRAIPIDITRQPLDPLQTCAAPSSSCAMPTDAPPWSLGFEPMRRAGPDYEVDAARPRHCVRTAQLGRRAPRRGPGAASPRASRSNSDARRPHQHRGPAAPRRLTSYRELAVHELGAYLRDPDFNAMHVETLVRPARSTRSWPATGCCATPSPAACRTRSCSTPSGRRRGAELLGYEDSRTRFIGPGGLARPAAASGPAGRAQHRRRGLALHLRSRGEPHGRGRPARQGPRRLLFVDRPRPRRMARGRRGHRPHLRRAPASTPWRSGCC